MSKDIFLNTISVENFQHDEYVLYWQDNDGNNSEYICKVHGYENALRVAQGIGHEQAEYIKYGVA
tara:strand:- start:258 stop:452 length:195 start_codon:yes stop_codon:yes gene_type:complete